MSGEELRNKLTSNGYRITELAALLNLSQPNFSRYLGVNDVKTGFIEKLCDKLDKDLSFIYGGTKYLPSIQHIDEDVVPKKLYEELKEEIYQYRDTIKDLKHQIALMQQGITIPEIAQRKGA